MQSVSDISENNSEWWIGSNYIKLRINFNSFSNKETLELTNEKMRKDRIENIWSTIKEYINEVKKIKTRG